MNITWEMVAAFITVAGFIAGVWWRLQSMINMAEDKADKALLDLQAYKLHVAETYANKDGVNIQFAAVSKSITEVGERMEKRLDGMNERLDRVIEAGQKPQRTRAS